jgi:hypothetical protein
LARIPAHDRPAKDRRLVAGVAAVVAGVTSRRGSAGDGVRSP